MSARAPFHVVVGTDGSRPAAGAIAATVAFPWPAGTRVSAVIARSTAGMAGLPAYPIAEWDRQWTRVAARATRALAARWPHADVSLVDDTAVDAILTEAKRRSADAIVVGWRGYGPFRRLLMGSVSRGVVRQAACPVLVTRGRPRPVRRIVIGVDGSPESRRAVEFVARLAPGGGHVTLVSVIEPMTLPSIRLMPRGVASRLRAEAAALARRRAAQAERVLRAAVDRLVAAGFKTRAVIRRGTPLDGLLAAAAASRANLLVVGRRGVGAVERLLLGSVAEGALNHARVPVLVAP